MNGAGNLFFTDSNLLLYAVDARDPHKQLRAEAWLIALWSSGRGRLSWQVLHEFYWNATRKFHGPAKLVREKVVEYCGWGPVDSSLDLVERAWNWADDTGIAYWDALIVAAAERCGASYLLSEDFQAGQRFGECTVLNPFASDPADYLPAPVA